MKQSIQHILFLSILFIVFSFKKANHPSANKIEIQFENFVGNDLLHLNSSFYQNSLNQSFSVSKFKYYISDVHLKQKNGKEFISKDFFLINEADEKSKFIMLDGIPSGEYDQISFTLGVDSIHNCSGVQEGALDPVNGMFWAWNTGYVFMKFEGTSPESKSPKNILEFHIGGYREPVNCIRTIFLPFENNNLNFTGENTLSVKIKTDIAQIFKSPDDVDFSKLSSVTDFHNATMIADNYIDMFSVSDVQIK